MRVTDREVGGGAQVSVGSDLIGEWRSRSALGGLVAGEAMFATTLAASTCEPASLAFAVAGNAPLEGVTRFYANVVQGHDRLSFYPLQVASRP
jgi:hypothetical protein